MPKLILFLLLIVIGAPSVQAGECDVRNPSGGKEARR